MNERSSRSHSVFTLKVRGVNPLTDEKCEAMLNLGQSAIHLATSSLLLLLLPVFAVWCKKEMAADGCV
jgi:hypothetical protein